MLRQTVRSFGALSIADNTLPASHLSRQFSARSKSDKNSNAEVGAVQTWLASLSSRTIPESVAVFTYSKSSGSGGQHVNR